MSPPPKDPDKIPKPRASRVRSGKPTPPPLETAAGTPEVRARGKGGRKRAEQTTASGMSEAPQADFGVGPLTPALTPGGEVELRPQPPSRPSYDLEETHKPLPALRQQGPLPPMGGAPIGKYLDALLAKPEERSERARKELLRQPADDRRASARLRQPADVHAAPAAAPGEVRRRHPLRDRVGVRRPRATSRPPSPSWSPASTSTSATRCCSASPARARPSPWPR